MTQIKGFRLHLTENWTLN